MEGMSWQSRAFFRGSDPREELPDLPCRLLYQLEFLEFYSGGTFLKM